MGRVIATRTIVKPSFSLSNKRFEYAGYDQSLGLRAIKKKNKKKILQIRSSTRQTYKPTKK